MTCGSGSYDGTVVVGLGPSGAVQHREKSYEVAVAVAAAAVAR